jgi:hypothetical protein
MGRLRQIVLIAVLLPLCWFWMMAVHEFGHVVGLWATGGTVARVVLHPLTISRTDPGENPNPLAEVWAGPVIGSVLPVAAFALAAVARLPAAYLVRFFAGFCLIANGCYIGVGVIDPVGDARELLRNGASTWQLGLFGAVTVPLGLYLWHEQGKHFRRENSSAYSAVGVGYSAAYALQQQYHFQGVGRAPPATVSRLTSCK